MPFHLSIEWNLQIKPRPLILLLGKLSPRYFLKCLYFWKRLVVVYEGINPGVWGSISSPWYCGCSSQLSWELIFLRYFNNLGLILNFFIFVVECWMVCPAVNSLSLTSNCRLGGETHSRIMYLNENALIFKVNSSFTRS